jgi:hypothetical protein
MVVTTRETREETIKRLRRYVGRLESRYECSSAEMLSSLRMKQAKETAEISRWMMNYEALQGLEKTGQNGPTTGIRTSNT